MYIRHILPQPELGLLPLDPANVPMSGVIRFAWDLAIQQSKEGHRVEIISPLINGRSHGTRISNVDIHWLAIRKHLNTKRIDMSYLLPLLPLN